MYMMWIGSAVLEQIKITFIIYKLYYCGVLKLKIDVWYIWSKIIDIIILFLPILILLTATLATSVQMKEHPYVIRFNNAYHSYLQFEYNMG